MLNVGELAEAEACVKRARANVETKQDEGQIASLLRELEEKRKKEQEFAARAFYSSTLYKDKPSA